MRTFKINTTIAAVNLALFMSVAAIANPFASNTGDVVKSGVKKQISGAGTAISNKVDSDFYYLRFDVNKFAAENAIVELPALSMDYLRFDVNNYIDGNETEITELPAKSYFGYLRFDANKFVEINNADNFELPATDFEYLRFDVNKFAGSSTINIDELPAQ